MLYNLYHCIDMGKNYSLVYYKSTITCVSTLHIKRDVSIYVHPKQRSKTGPDLTTLSLSGLSLPQGSV